MNESLECVRLASSEAEYRKLGLLKNKVRSWEDRVHFDQLPGSFEWFFAKVDSKEANAIIGLTTAPNFQGELGQQPTLNLMVTLPSGEIIVREIVFDSEKFKPLENHEGVAIGENYYKNESMHKFNAHAEDDDLVVDLEIEVEAPSWRPETGHFIFGEEDENYFGWTIPAPPTNKAKVKISSKEINIDCSGVGYVDRGWTNKPFGEFMNNWNWYYWNFEDYTVIAINITFEEKYGYSDFPLFMVYKDNQLLAGGPGTQNKDYITYTINKSHLEEDLNRIIVDSFTYNYQDGEEEFILEVENEKQDEVRKWSDTLCGTQEQKETASIRKGAEVRLDGTATFIHKRNNHILNKITVDKGAFDELQFMGLTYKN